MKNSPVNETAEIIFYQRRYETAVQWSPRGPIRTDGRMRTALPAPLSHHLERIPVCDVLRACEALPPESEPLTCGSELSYPPVAAAGRTTFLARPKRCPIPNEHEQNR